MLLAASLCCCRVLYTHVRQTGGNIFLLFLISVFWGCGGKGIAEIREAARLLGRRNTYRGAEAGPISREQALQ